MSACKRSNWLEFDKGYYCRNCEYLINKQKHQVDKKVLRQDHNFSTRLTYANKRKREIWIKIVIINYNSKEEMVIKLQQLKGKTKLKLYKTIGDYYDDMNIRFDEDPFA